VGVVALAAVALATVVCLGCGRDTEEPKPQVEWKTSKTLPADLPPDLPVYPAAKVVKVVSGAGAVVVWHTPDPVASVQEYYTREMNGKGWHVTSYPGVAATWMGEGGVTVIGTKWGRQITVALGEQGNGTVITLVLGGKRQAAGKR